MGKFLGFLLLVLALARVPPSEARARLLASKTLLNEYAVETKDLTIRYSIYNVGTSPAQSVVLDDDSFPPEEFTVVQGMLSTSWERLSQNSNVTHNVILQVKEPGRYNFSWARLSYTTDDGLEQVGYTSAPGEIMVNNYREFSRNHELHVVEWLAFVAMSTPTIVLPLLLWYRSYSKYEKLKAKKA